MELTSGGPLLYPELYVVKGGYKAFHAAYPQLCTPEGSYLTMDDKAWKSEKDRHEVMLERSRLVVRAEAWASPYHSLL